MNDSKKDMWSQWLLDRRFGGDPERMKKMLEYLYPVRDRVLSRIQLGENETLLDVGCGDGLIAFGALEKFERCQVIFSDISADLLAHSKTLAQQMEVEDLCRFVCASADDLSALESETVDAVTTRSVLIYVSAKQRAFDEFHRVLKPGGKLSIFEPINRFAWPEPPDRFNGYDAAPIADITRKLVALYERIQPLDSDPMGDFDERDLVTQAEKAGFSEIHMDLQIEVKPNEDRDWSAFMHTAWNPKIPTLAEAIREALTPSEAEKFVQHIRPQVESGQGKRRMAVAYLWAVK